MGFFDRFRKENKQENRAENGIVSFDDALLAALLGQGSITKKLALQIPTISGGVDLIASIVAGTPIRLFRDEGGKTEEIQDDYRLPLLNDETGDTLNANEFWHAMIRDYYTGKGGYAYLNKVRGKIRSIHYVDEEQVAIIKNADPIFKDFSIQVNGGQYKPWDFLKILRNTTDGAEGIPITKENSRLIEVAAQQLTLEYTMAKRGGNKKGFLKAERRLDEPSMTALKDAWRKMYAEGQENVVILNAGMDFKESSETSAEMQLDENKRTNAQEFAKIFHVSPEAMSGSEKDIGALAKLAAVPLMQVIQCALNRDLLLEREKGKLYFAFDTKELLKGTMSERAEFYAKLIEANVVQIDEVRYMEDLPPLGLGFIKLGLQDVLYDPKTKIVYTPNTNQSNRIGEGSFREAGQMPGSVPEENPAAEDTEPTALPDDADHDIIEPEARGNNYIQDPTTGRMNGSHPSSDSDSGGSDSGGKSKEKDKPDSTGNEENKEKDGKKKDIDFYTGPNRKTLEAEYSEWIGDSKREEYLSIGKDSMYVNAINQLYREGSFIGDGGTAAVHQFERATGRQCGKSGTHLEKCRGMIKYIENRVMNQNLTTDEKTVMDRVLKDLKEAIKGE